MKAFDNSLSKCNSVGYEHDITTNNKKSGFKMFCKTIMLFSTVFSLHPYWGLPAFLTPRIITMALCLVIIAAKIRHFRVSFSKDYIVFFLVSLLVPCYSGFLAAANGVTNGVSMTSSAFNFLIFVVIFLPFAKKFFSSAEEFCVCMLNAAFIQAVIVLLGVLIPDVRTMLETMQDFGSDGLYTGWRYTWRIIGFGIAGAGGSIYLFSGLIAAGWLFINRRIRKILFIQIALLLVAILLVGRTGFYCSLVLIAFFIYDDIFNKGGSAQNIINLMVCILIAGAVIIALFKIDSVNQDLMSYTFGRSLELFENSKDGGVLAHVLKAPELCWETIIGTGITRGTSASGLYAWSDSGYIQRYMAIGIIVGGISYISFVSYVCKSIHTQAKHQRQYLYIVLLLLLVIELKEPFIYQLAYPFVLLMLAKLSSRDSVGNNTQHSKAGNGL